MRLRVIALVASVLVPAAAVLAQFTPTAKPEGQPAPGGAGDGSPQTPIKPAPGGAPDEFPGPRGTKIKFPTGLYDENAVAAQQIVEARKIATREGKRILVMWGENKCGFCVFLNDVLKNDINVGPLVKTEYVWIKIDIGKFDRNLDVAQKYDTPILEQTFGAPALTVIDPVADKAVATKGGNSLTAKPMQVDRVFDEKVIRDFLMTNRPPARVARSVFNDVAAKAGGGGKLVLVYFVVPLSDECETIDRWVADPEVAKALAKGYEVVKIDNERMIGGRTVLNSLSEGKIVAPPFIAISNSSGDLAAPGATFAGLPTDPAETKRFVETLVKLSGKLDMADEAVLSKGVATANVPPAPEGAAPKK